MAVQHAPELKPEVTFLFDLVRQLRSGDLRIPRFQRPFVWKRRQMIDLLDSIRRQYPVGSLLAWETSSPLSSLSHVGPMQLPAGAEVSTPAYILDGHQRLSTLAGTLSPSMDVDPALDADDPGRWRVCFNAEDDRFEHVPLRAELSARQFPLSKILDTIEFIDECQRVVDTDPQNGRRYVSRIQEVARAFQTYRIPVVRIRDTGLNEAVEIFARLNSKGQAMTPDQMVSALLYREGEKRFDLADEIDDVMEMLSSVGFGTIDRAVVLRTLLAVVGEDIYRTDWTKIALTRRDELLTRLESALPAVKSGLSRAIKFLSEQVGVHNERLLPYAMQLVVLGTFFAKVDSPSNPQVAYLRRWFWVSSFGAWFGGTNPSRVNALIREVASTFAAEREQPVLSSIDLESPAQPIPESFDMRSARARALLLVLLGLDPRGTDGQPISDPSFGILAIGPEAVGHIVTASGVEDKSLARSPANRIIKPDLSDRSQAKNWLVDLPSGLQQEICVSHAIDSDSLQLLRDRKADEFLARRLNYLIEAELHVMKVEGVTPPPSTAPTPSPLDAE